MIKLASSVAKEYNINKTLINEGHAYVYEGGTKKVYKENNDGKLDK